MRRSAFSCTATSARSALSGLPSTQPQRPPALPRTPPDCTACGSGGGTLRATPPGEVELRRSLAERLAADRILVTRSVPVRVCATCRRPHSPESVIYQEEVGSVYLVRFPIRDADPPAALLVWTDAAWKLLATTALLVNPTL